MDPGAVLHPVGPEPPRVYWMRRAVVIAVVVVVVVLVAHACAGGGSRPAREVGATPQPARTSVSTTPSALPTHRAAPRCRRAQLQLTASTDAPSYADGVLPKFTAVLRNTGSAGCRFPSQPSARVWTVVSGADRIWSSADCTGSDRQALGRLKPDRTVAYAVTWDRHRSQPGCPSTGAAADHGTYRLSVRIAGVDAAPVVFQLSGANG